MATYHYLLTRTYRVNDYALRILRQTPTGSEIVYVSIADCGVLPHPYGTTNDEIMEILRKLPEFHQAWTTLSVFPEGGKVKAEKDMFPPHQLTSDQLPGNYPVFDYLQVPTVASYVEGKVSRVIVNDKECYLKIAELPSDVEGIAKEIRAYHVLTQAMSSTAPDLLGYALEGNSSRIVGFFVEAVEGRDPVLGDLHRCQLALARIHQLGIVHGDVWQGNILITRNNKMLEETRSEFDDDSTDLEYGGTRIDDVISSDSDSDGGVPLNPNFLAGLRITLA